MFSSPASEPRQLRARLRAENQPILFARLDRSRPGCRVWRAAVGELGRAAEPAALRGHGGASCEAGAGESALSHPAASPARPLASLPGRRLGLSFPSAGCGMATAAPQSPDFSCRTNKKGPFVFMEHEAGQGTSVGLFWGRVKAGLSEGRRSFPPGICRRTRSRKQICELAARPSSQLCRGTPPASWHRSTAPCTA